MKGGHNKETFMLSVKTFKSLCLKAGTKKADEIHEYYMKMEEIIHQVIQEESDELKMQLENKNIQLNQEKNKIVNLNLELHKKDVILDNQVMKSELEKANLNKLNYSKTHFTPFLISNAQFFLVFMTTMTLESEFCIFMFF
jgi:hypothetical protein